MYLLFIYFPVHPFNRFPSSRYSAYRLLVDLGVCVTFPSHETESETHYGDLDRVKLDSSDSHGRTLSALAELGMESLVYPALYRSSRALWVLCRSPTYGEIFRPRARPAAIIVRNLHPPFRNRSVCFSPIFSYAHLDPEWNAERHDTLHGFAHEFLYFLDLFLRHFK